MAMNGVLLTVAEVERWRKEKEQLEVEIRERQKKLALLKRKLDAADILSVSADVLEEKSAMAEDVTSAEDSIPDALSANLRETGQSLNVRQIRARLIELGFINKLRDRPNYVYGLVYRMTKSGKLLKRGTKYRAAPISSSQGEPEDVSREFRRSDGYRLRES
jgi:hypothetical protein